MLSREQLARVLGVAPNTIKSWTADGTIPSTMYVLSGAGSRSSYEFSPRAVVVGELILELNQVFGSDNSPLPKRIAAALREQLDRVEWSESTTARLTVKCSNGFELLISDLQFLKTAKQKLAALDQ